MNCSFICTKCRQNLLSRAAKQIQVGDGGRRGFISLRPQDDSKDQTPPETSYHSPFRGSLLGDQGKKKPLPNFNPLPKVDHALTDLFIAKERIGPSVMSRYSKVLYPAREKPTDVPKLESSQLEKDLTSINEALIDADGVYRDPLAAWRLFEQSASFSLSLDPSERSAVDKQLMQDSPVLTGLLTRIVRLRVRERRHRDSISLPKVIGWYSDLGLMDGRWTAVLYRYIVTLIFNARHSNPNSGYDPVYVSHNVVLQDLCKMWKWFLETFRASEPYEQTVNPINQTVIAEMEEAIKQRQQDSIKPQSPGRRLPSVSNMFLYGSIGSLKLTKPLVAFCASRGGLAEGKLLALAALLTCHLIHSFEIGGDCWNEIVPDDELHHIFVAFAVYGRWLDKASINEAYPRMRLSFKSSSAIREELRSLRKESADPVNKTLSELNKAVHERKIGSLIRLKDLFNVRVQSGELSREEQMQLYGPFMAAFLGMRRTEQAIEVWNSMIQAGNQPRKEHWLVMLEGAVRAGDTDSLESIWVQIRAASIEPDNDMWTWYLRGLFKFRQWERGLEAVGEMGVFWKSGMSALEPNLQDATTADITTTVISQSGCLPDMGPINVAISGLQKVRRQTHIQKVLDWAASFDLKPDAKTYHFFLLDAVRGGNVDEVNRLLRSMKIKDIVPSVEIFTILMDFAFRSTRSDFQLQSPEQQQATITRVLADMEEAGIQADDFTYGTLLSGLLKPPCLNIVAARAIMEHMGKKEIRISPQIHTILMSYYFSQDPPDLAAIDSLWAKIQVEKHAVDHVFFDRMIDEYARIGELEKMLIFLRKMVAGGKIPGWNGLSRIVRALADAREWGWVQDLLNDVVDERGLFRYGARTPRGKDAFWELVDQIRQEGVELPRRPADIVVSLSERNTDWDGLSRG